MFKLKRLEHMKIINFIEEAGWPIHQIGHYNFKRAETNKTELLAFSSSL